MNCAARASAVPAGPRAVNSARGHRSSRRRRRRCPRKEEVLVAVLVDVADRGHASRRSRARGRRRAATSWNVPSRRLRKSSGERRRQSRPAGRCRGGCQSPSGRSRAAGRGDVMPVSFVTSAKRAVAVVAEEPRRRRCAVDSDNEVEIAVVIGVEPRRGASGACQRREPGGRRRVRESLRVRVEQSHAGRPEHREVAPPVIVVVTGEKSSRRPDCWRLRASRS